ncbi:hypothetical protein WNY63_16915 [Pseudoalteromonas neustonica]|uniref:Phage abortive infection protein n=1 Tax=Pseudoalteromonas neustonica TaxID=1840331 RepID=A0ABU9U5T9_9GAMM
MLNKKNKNYSAIIAVIVATLVSVISLLIFLYRFGFNFNAPIKSWIDGATYFNNLLSPIFIFITILLLYWTWKDTKEGLELQRKDNLFNSICLTFTSYTDDFISKSKVTSIFSEEFVDNVEVTDPDFISTFEIMRLLGNSYLQFGEDVERGQHIEEQFDLQSRVAYLEQLRINKAQVVIFATYAYRLYSSLTEESHQKTFILLLYGKLGIERLISLVLVKESVREIIESAGDGTTDIRNEIEFLKIASLLPHTDKNKTLEKKLYQDKVINCYLKG